MPGQVLAAFIHPSQKKYSGAVVDDGRCGYLNFYQGVRQKELIGMAWIYTRPELSGAAVPATAEEDELPHDPPPAHLVGSQGICAMPEASAWSLIWTTQGSGCILLQDGAPVVFEDPRNENTYCAGLNAVWNEWDWRPFPLALRQSVLNSIVPPVTHDGKRVRLPTDSQSLANHRVELPELPHQRIKYGKPKRIDKIKLADALAYPLWVGMVEDDRYDEEWERPVVGQTDVDEVLLSTIGIFNTALLVTVQIQGTELYAVGELSNAGDALESLAFWNGKTWAPLAQIATAAPIAMTAVPSIRGVSAVRFQCPAPATGRATRVTE
jgi:hypothetical protein